jgi:hypothetical protein
VDEVVRNTVEETLNALLDAEADQLCGARRYERSEGRKDTRAGSYEWQLQTKAGEVSLKVPKLRSLPIEAAIIGRRGSCGDVPGGGEPATRGRHHAGAAGFMGVGLDGERSESGDFRMTHVRVEPKLELRCCVFLV